MLKTPLFWKVFCAAFVVTCSLVACGSESDSSTHGSGGATSGGSGSGGTPDASAGFGGSLGGSGGVDAGLPATIFVSPHGLDTDPGTVEYPLQTIAKAISIAETGQTIVLMDGVFDSSTQSSFALGSTTSLMIPDGVNVRGYNASAVVLKGNNGPLFTTSGTSSIRDLVIRGFGRAVEAKSGVLTMTGLFFEHLGGETDVAIQLSGDVKATLTADWTDHYVGSFFTDFAVLSDQAELTISAGSIDTPSPGGSEILVHDNAKLTLLAVKLSDNVRLLTADGASRVVFEQGSLDGFGGGFTTAGYGVGLRGNAKLTATGTLLWEGGLAISLEDASSVTLDGCSVSENAQAIRTAAGFTGNIVIKKGTFLNDKVAITATGGNFELSDTTFAKNGDAVVLENAKSAKLRNNVFTFNTVAVRVSGSSDYNFGKLGDPGNNDFSANNTPNDPDLANVIANMSAGARLYAIGNKWKANEQKADANGAYAAVGAGAVLELTGPEKGQNFILEQASVIRLAENP